MGVGTTGKKTEQKFAIQPPADHFGKYRWGIVIPCHQVVTRTGIDCYPSMTKMTVYDTRFVLLVVIDPEFDSRLGHGAHARQGIHQLLRRRLGAHRHLRHGSQSGDLEIRGVPVVRGRYRDRHLGHRAVGGPTRVRPRVTRPILCVLDGAKALKEAVRTENPRWPRVFVSVSLSASYCGLRTSIPAVVAAERSSSS